MYETDSDEGNGLISDVAKRGFLNHYTSEEYVDFLINFLKLTLHKLGYVANIHILDFTKVFVNVDNENYENSTLRKEDGELKRGYKLASLRGVFANSQVIEEIEIGTS